MDLTLNADPTGLGAASAPAGLASFGESVMVLCRENQQVSTTDVRNEKRNANTLLLFVSLVTFAAIVTAGSGFSCAQVNVPGAYATCAAGPSVSEAACRLKAVKLSINLCATTSPSLIVADVDAKPRLWHYLRG
jgi:hypothetical protein